MFGRSKKTQPRAANSLPYEIRATLFGDMPLAEWAQAAKATPAEPWSSFASAQDQIAAGAAAAAVTSLRGVLAQPGLDSRQYLQAYHFLRELGVEPPADLAKHIYGVVVEVGVNGGLDIVAAYADHTARYYNFSGAAVIWEAPGTTLDATIDALLEAGRVVAAQIGPWTEPRPPAPPQGEGRISMLTPSGLHFGQAEMGLLMNDPLAAPVLQRAQRLMEALMAESERSKAR